MLPRRWIHPVRELPRTALPALLLAFGIFVVLARPALCAPGDESWWTGFGARLQGTVVNSLVPYGSYLYAGGGFSGADGHVANNIARWDGASWDTLTTGTDGWVNCMAVYNNQLYVAGSFANAGGSPSNNIAMWDGSAWHDVGGGLWFDTFPANQGRVWGMTVWNGVLYVVGQFGRCGGTTLKHFGVAAWNGGSWFEPGPSFGNPPGSVYPYGTGLMYGGYIIRYDGSFHWMLDWDGVSTDALTNVGSPDLDNTPYVMTTYNNNLIVGGEFANAGGSAARFIAQWDGTTWSPVGTGVGPSTTATAQSVNALAVHAGALIAGGYFWTAGGASANYIASWDGAYWRPLGSGTDYTVDALASWNGDLYAGGGFTHAGGSSSNLIARWTGTVTGVADAAAAKPTLALEPARPSPFHDATRFAYTLPRPGHVTLDVFDIGGRRVARVEAGVRSAGRHEVMWGGRGPGGGTAPAGVYFARLTTDEGSASRRMVLVR